MTVIRKTSNYLVARILAGLLGAYFVYTTVYDLVMVASTLKGGERLEVVMVFASGAAVNGILSVISILFILRGHLPAGRRQAGKGCLFLITAIFASSVIAGLVVAILNLEAGLESALRLDIIFSGGALGGVLGLYMARPVSTTLHPRLEDKREFVGSTSLEESSLPLKPAREKPLLVAVMTALLTSFFGCLLTYISPLLSPCVPSETASDSGAVLAFGTISLLIWIVAGPMAMLLGGLLAHCSFKWIKLSERKNNPILVALVLGGFSGLVFLIVSMVVFQKLLCM